MSGIYECYLYQASITTTPFTLGEEAFLGTSILGTGVTESKPLALLTGWTTLSFTKRINKPDNHLIRFDLALEDPLVQTLRDSVETDSLLYVFREDSITGERTPIYAGLNRTVVDQVRVAGSVIITLYGSGPTEFLKRRVVYPPTGFKESSKSGTAEDIMKEFVEEQASAPTDPDRTVLGLTVEPDRDVSGDAEYSAEYVNLFTVLARCSEQSLVDFKVVPKYDTEKTTEDEDIAAAIPSTFSGKYYNGTYIGTAFENTFGPEQYAASFDGTDDVVDILTDALTLKFDKDTGTLAAWVKVSGSGIWTDGTPYTIAMLYADADNYILLQKYSGSNNTIRATYRAGGVSVTKDLTTSTTGWFHVAMSWDTGDDELKIYLNGAVVGAAAGGLGAWAGDIAQAYIGGESISSTGTSLLELEAGGALLLEAGGRLALEASSNSFSGYLKNVALWNTDLPQADISRIYSNPLHQRFNLFGYVESSLIGLWELNEFSDAITSGVFVFRTKRPWGNDRTIDNTYGNVPAVFDLFLQNMEIPILSTNTSEERNLMIMAGAGQYPDRLLITRSNPTAINRSIWNRRELYTAMPRVTEQSELEAEGDRLLEERKVREKLTFNVKQTPAFSWLDNWDLGDYVTALYFDKQFTKQVSEIDVLVTPGASGSSTQVEVITAELIDVTGGWILGTDTLGEGTRLV